MNRERRQITEFFDKIFFYLTPQSTLSIFPPCLTIVLPRISYELNHTVSLVACNVYDFIFVG